MILGVIADDFTGATDVASMLVRAGMHTVQVMGVPAAGLPQADAVFLACGNWWTASIVADLEAKLKKPVLTTNNMALWASLQMMGVEEKVAGFGRLLEEMPPLRQHFSLAA